MKNFMLVVVLLLHLAPFAELCAFEELAKGYYNTARIGTKTGVSEKECMVLCYNNPECTIGGYHHVNNQCYLFKEGPNSKGFGSVLTGFRLNRNLVRSTCPKLASLP